MNTRKQNYQELIANIYMQIKGLVYICEGWHTRKKATTPSFNLPRCASVLQASLVEYNQYHSRGNVQPLRGVDPAIPWQGTLPTRNHTGRRHLITSPWICSAFDHFYLHPNI